MKHYRVHFRSRSVSLSSRDAYIDFQIDTFEHLTPRLRRIIEQLNKLPNPTGHGSWFIDDISEQKKEAP